MNKTVFIVGAGASHEAGLPLGTELKNQIASMLDIRFKNGFEQVSGDQAFVEYLRFESRERTQGAVNINPFIHECRKIASSMPQALSIDNFLDAHSDNPDLVFCGKLAIAKCILAAEKKSRLWVDTQNIRATLAFPQLEGTWYARLFHKVVEGCKFDRLPERLEKIAFVVFNYDRCIEQFLSYAVANYYHVPYETAVEVLAHVEIFHPYGKVGNILVKDGSERTSFGADAHPMAMLAIAKSVKTFTESVDPETSGVSDMRRLIGRARMLGFLGFAYHRQNLELLFSSQTEFEDSHQIDVLGTGVGVSDRDIELLRNELKSGLRVPRDRIHIQRGVGCYEFFAENSRNLALA